VALKSFFKFDGSAAVKGEQPVKAQTLQMRISASTQSYDFSIRDEHISDWVSLGSIDALEMTACDFNGTIFGMWASTAESAEDRLVQFEAFYIS
jgi:Beta xylosidase C-terminal Concanavalin A-like domain